MRYFQPTTQREINRSFSYLNLLFDKKEPEEKILRRLDFFCSDNNCPQKIKRNDCPSYFRLASQSIGWLAGSLVGQSVDQSVGCLLRAGSHYSQNQTKSPQNWHYFRVALPNLNCDM